MTYQIDQSGKIEQTEKDTIIAYSNDEQKSIVIPKKIKRQIQEAFRLCGYSRLFIYYIFAIGIFYLIKDFKITQSITIDIEYQRKDILISQLIKKLLKAYGKPRHQIRFHRIGNRPKVHYAAHDVFTKKKKADYIISFEEIIKATKKTDGRLRECLSTLVGVQPRSLKKRITKKKAIVKNQKTLDVL